MPLPCQQCEKPATFHITELTGEEHQEIHLCEDHARVYLMQTEDDADDLLAELKSGAIFKFQYSFRGGLEADAGFLLMGEDGDVFFAVGNPTEMQFIELAQTSGLFAEDGELDENDDDLMDFGMI